MNVADQINSVVDNLANKLNVAVDKVYSALINQSKVDASLFIINMIIGCICLTIGLIVLSKALKRNENGRHYISYLFNNGNAGVSVFMGFCICVLLCMGMGLLFGSIGNLLTATYNPEFYAINQILKMIK
jgi:hypothetical protein